MASAAIQKGTRLTEFLGGAGIKTLALSSIFVLGSALRLKRVPAPMRSRSMLLLPRMLPSARRGR